MSMVSLVAVTVRLSCSRLLPSRRTGKDPQKIRVEIRMKIRMKMPVKCRRVETLRERERGN